MENLKEILKVKISLTNSKLGAIPSVNLPAVITCRDDAPCKKYCYACKGAFCYKNVKVSLLNNLEVFCKNKDYYFNYIQNYLNGGLVIYKYFRWHSSGDIVNADYLAGVVEVAKSTPLTRHLIFTKKFELVNDFIKKGGKIPANLSIVFSAWGDDFKVPNPYNLPVSYVKFKSGLNCNNIPADAFPCSGSCEKCQKCWHLKKGEAVTFNQH